MKKEIPTKQLLNLTIYRYSENDFYKLRQKCDVFNQLKKELPEYCLNVESVPFVTTTIFYHQYTGNIDEYKHQNEKEYYLFNVNFSTELLDYEISQFGFVELMNIYKINLYDIFSKCFINYRDDRTLPIQSNIVFDFKYVGNFDECDLNLSLYGYLDSNYNLIEHKF